MDHTPYLRGRQKVLYKVEPLLPVWCIGGKIVYKLESFFIKLKKHKYYNEIKRHIMAATMANRQKMDFN
jgi:hypothetical protein